MEKGKQWSLTFTLLQNLERFYETFSRPNKALSTEINTNLLLGTREHSRVRGMCFVTLVC